MCCVKQRFVDQGGHGNKHPFSLIRRGWRLASPRCRWPSARCPLSGFLSTRHHVCLSIGRLALIRGILENVPHSLTRPDALTSGGRCTSLLKSTADFGKAAAVSADPQEDLLNYLCVLSHRLKSRLTAPFTDSHIVISERRTRHHVKRPILSSMLLASAAPLHDLGSLIFG